MAGAQVLPLRPLTVGELLDAAVGLLRQRALGLLSTALLLAAIEQAALYGLHTWAPADPFVASPSVAVVAVWWLVVSAGMGTQAAVITVLGARAAPTALSSLLGGAPAGQLGHRRWRTARISLLAAVVGVGAAVSFGAGVLGWLFWFGFTGLAGPSLINDIRMRTRRGPAHLSNLGVWAALRRGISLSAGDGLRPAAIRLMAYSVWWVLRVALGGHSFQFLAGQFGLNSQRWLTAVSLVAATVVNAFAYTAIGCLDAVSHLEVRMRVEGIDIALGRAIRAGAPLVPLLAVPQKAGAVPR